MKVIRVQIKTNPSGVASFKYGEMEVEGESMLLRVYDDFDLSWSGFDFVCSFGMFSEVGEPYVPMFRCLAAHLGLELIGWEDEDGCQLYVVSTSGAWHGRSEGCTNHLEFAITNACYEMIFIH